MLYKKMRLLLVGILYMLFSISSAQAVVTGTLSITSATHQQNVSSTNSTVSLSWSGVSAGTGKSPLGYEYVLDQVATTSPSAFQSQFNATASATLKHANVAANTTVTLSSLVDGSWYFHLRASDTDGVAGAMLKTFGPIILDSAPTISNATPITPATGTHKQAINVTINGTNFMTGVTVALINGASSIALSNIVLATNKQQITATVPANTAPATYDLRVTNAAPFNKQVTVNAAYQSTNQTPIAKAGTNVNLSLNAGSTVTLALDGTASSDPDADLLTYAWTTVSDPSTKLATQFTTASKNLTVSTAGTYTFSLKVNDGFIDSGVSQVSYVVTAVNTNNPPVANAGADQLVASATNVALSGAQSSDPDGNPLTYAWSFASKPATSQLTVTSILQTKGTANATATFTPDVSGAYTINLIVNDGTVNSPPNQVVITVNNKPTANAGTVQLVPPNQKVTLDATGSTDPEGNPLSYVWSITSQPGTNVIALSSTTASKPTFTPADIGTYVFSLIVNDGFQNSAAATVTITVANAFTYNYTLTKNVGPSLTAIGYVVVDANITNAQSLFAAVPNINQLSRWDAASQQYVSYVNAVVNNFTITPGEAYFISVSATSSVSFTGPLPSPTITYTFTKNTGPSLTAIGLRKGTVASGVTNAQQLFAAIPNINQLSRWDAASQQYVSYVNPVVNNFNLADGNAYFISVSATGTW